MSLRTKMLGLVDVFMRVPPLFILDEILKINLGIQLHLQTHPATTTTLPAPSTESDVTTNVADVVNSTVAKLLDAAHESGLGASEEDLYKYVSLSFIKFLLCLAGCASAICAFLLWTRHLAIVYLYIISVGLVFLSYWDNVAAITDFTNHPIPFYEVLLDPGGSKWLALKPLLPHLVGQWMIGMVFAYIHLGPRHNIIQKWLPLNFLAPLCLALLPIPATIVRHAPAFAAVLPLVLSKIALWSYCGDIYKTLFNGYTHARNFARNFGLSALVENEWQRLNVPCVLRAFWSLRIAIHFVTISLTADAPLAFAATAQKMLVTGCETLTAVLGMTSIISLICHYIGKAFQFFLMSENYDQDQSIGTVSAILFYILALQTGLTSLSPEKRFIRLCRNLCLLITALLHFLHNIVAPILMSLSAARNPHRKKHIRALLVCIFLVIAPITLLTVLWSRHAPSTWLLAVTAFSVEVIVKVIVSLATYTLFLLDAQRQEFWEKLDDYVYYIKAFGNSVEFCFGIFLFFNGAWILVFESGGAIRALMMCIHAYFNIWCEARAGWSVFIKRRTAVHKISALPEATPMQLQMFDDVCAICYQEMTSAKITRCRHYFHGVCLRKWLYVQDKCPLCHEIIINQDAVATSKNNEAENENINNHNIEMEQQQLLQNNNPLNQAEAGADAEEMNSQLRLRAAQPMAEPPDTSNASSPSSMRNAAENTNNSRFLNNFRLSSNPAQAAPLNFSVRNLNEDLD